MNKYYVYAHVNAKSGVVFYIGKGTRDRAKSLCRRSDRWHNYVKKYGYFILYLDENISQDESFMKEVYYIKYFGRKDYHTGSLINMSDGGVGGNNNKGRVFSDEWKRKLSESQKGRIGTWRGKKHSEETKKKMSQSQKGKDVYWLRGRKISSEEIQSRLSRPKIKCEHCGDFFRDGAYYNYHGDKCSINPKRERKRSPALTVDKENEIERLLSIGVSKKEVARRFKINEKTVFKILRYKQIYESGNKKIEKFDYQPIDQTKKVNFNGKIVSIRDLRQQFNCSLPYKKIRERLNHLGWSVEDALTIPAGMKRSEYRNAAQGKLIFGNGN
jgi:DNA-binding CsgD family transcriptional regulator